MDIGFRSKVVSREGAEDQGQTTAEETREKGREEPGQDHQHDQRDRDAGDVAEGREKLLGPPLGSEIPREGEETGAKTGKNKNREGKSPARPRDGTIDAESDGTGEEIQKWDD